MEDASYLTNGYLETIIDWIPSMKGIRLKDFPSFIRTTDPNDFMLKVIISEFEKAKKASAIILNSFDELKHDVIDALSSILPPIYSVGPLPILQNHIQDNDLKLLGLNLWKEESECLQWLDTKEHKSVVYVNFGSFTVMTPNQMIEFAWGLANSSQNFLWIIRSDLVIGDLAVLPPEFVDEIKDRGMLARWCPQEKVLGHPAIGGFLTHCGWNSTLESISAGVPMICWPFFADQQTNCWFCCSQWGIGMEIENDATRNKIESFVRELMNGERGKEMKNNALDWKKKAAEATAGAAYVILEKMINQREEWEEQFRGDHLWENMSNQKKEGGELESADEEPEPDGPRWPLNGVDAAITSEVIEDGGSFVKDEELGCNSSGEIPKENRYIIDIHHEE
ncbi:unnamed protein product [Ilex paraguariensis]|uniref:Glycosyltransferase n=1 Tax=Ilex paraguariensis TaxID=185542 RepID=A0ABC8TR52_9AQUA